MEQREVREIIYRKISGYVKALMERLGKTTFVQILQNNDCSQSFM